MSDLAKYAERDRWRREGLRQGRIEGVAEERTRLSATILEACRAMRESDTVPEVADTLSAVHDWLVGLPVSHNHSLTKFIQGYLEYGAESREIEREKKAAQAASSSASPNSGTE